VLRDRGGEGRGLRLGTVDLDSIMPVSGIRSGCNRQPDPSFKRLSAGRRAHQGDGAEGANELGKFWVVAVPQREAVASSRDHDRLPPAVLQGFLGDDEMAGRDLVPGPWQTLGGQRVRLVIGWPVLGSRRILDAALHQRLRALTAHEVGHGLGLKHQFIGSAQSNSSVMDYPFPKVDIGPDGRPRIGSPYPEGVGEWDKVVVRYGYRQIGSGDNEAIQLDADLRGARARGLYWMSDDDADGGAEPFVQRWDQGNDPVTELGQIMKIRAAALAYFSTDVISPSSPLALAQDTLVPIYLLHRFEVKAASSMLGGLHYEHAIGDSDPPRVIPGDQQRKALQALLATLDPKELTLPEKVLALMVPRPTGYKATRESFIGSTGVTFDAIHPAIDAARLTLDELMDKNRAARMIEFNARDGTMPGFEEVLEALLQATWKTKAEQTASGLQEAVRRAVARVTLNALLGVAGDQKAGAEVRAACWTAVLDLRGWLRTAMLSADKSLRAQYALAIWDIDRVERDPLQFKPVFDDIPPGQPLGYR